MPFSTLGLSQTLIKAVQAAGYNEPTPVQQQAIPAVLQGQDLMVAAQTGTGKTAGFALPILQQLFPEGQTPAPRQAKQVRVLVLAPTRELAAQVHESFCLYATGLPFASACVFGGVSANPQIRALAKGLDVLVACPGRLLDLLQQKAVDLSQVKTLVLDEADRMLDMGFIHDVKRVLKFVPDKRQNLLFSATFSNDIIALTNRLLHNPVRIEVTPPNTTVERIQQFMYRIPAPHKRTLLMHLITQGAWEQVLVFTRTKHGANRLAEFLSKNGLPAAAIHGNKSQNARTKALIDFKNNDVRVLVATDIAARGLDIDQLPYVVNYELPNVEEDYVHRIGRTGRAGRAGQAVSLVAHSEMRLLQGIEKVTRQSIPEGDWMGFDFAAAIEANVKAEKAEKAEKSERAERGRPAQRERTPNARKQPRQPRKTAAATEKGDAAAPAQRRNNRQRPAASAEAKTTAPARRQRAPRQDQAAKPELPPNRAPDVFLDDEVDNFGNSVDYVSPYQGQSRRGQSRPAARADAGRGAGRPAQRTANQGGRPARGKPQRAENSALFVGADPTPAYITAQRERERAASPAPLILRKGERLPSLEQLEQLEDSRSTKRERPALLGLRD